MGETDRIGNLASTFISWNGLLVILEDSCMMWYIFGIVAIAVGAKLMMDSKPPSRFPPGPKGLPLLGNFIDVAKLVKETKFHFLAWSRLAKDYGPVVGLRLGLSEPLIIVSGKEAVTEMLNRSEFDGRPDGFMFRHRTMGSRRGVIFTDGATWREQKRFSMRNLREFGFGRSTMESMILHEAVTLTRIITDKLKSGPVENVNRIATVAVLNSLWCLIAGQRFDQEMKDDGLTDILRVINDIFQESDVSGGILNHFPFLRHVIPELSGFTRRNVGQMRTWKFFENVVTQHKESRQMHTQNEARDLIDAYLAEIDTQSCNQNSSFDEYQLIALVKDLFTAGVETTSNSIGFTLLYLSAYPLIQKKIHEEIDRVLGKDGVPSDETRTRMPYVNAVIAEVARLSNVGPTSILHRALVDTKFFGYDIKKNYVLLANFYSVHMDVDHWGDPEVFRPDRFLDENGQFFNDPWIMPFGAGRRKCLGETLARKSQFILICCLLQKFSFHLPPGEPIPSLTGVNGFTISPPNFNAVVVIR